MFDFITELEAFMASVNFRIRGNINYNIMIWQRFSNGNSTKSSRDLFVRIHDDRRGATFGDWRDHSSWKTWRANKQNEPISYDQQREYKQWKLMIDAERIRKINTAIVNSARTWMNAKSYYAGVHPYVLRKCINPYYARCIVRKRWIKDVLLVPIHNVNYSFRGLQIIKANGFKRFWKGTTLTGNMIWLSERLSHDYSGKIHVCEGYATGCSIYEAIGSPVVCALNNHNLIKVCEQLKAQFPLAQLCICADNDAWTKDNPGVSAALQAMKRTGAHCRIPKFDQYDQSMKPTDFNDLFVLAGIEAVENQLIKQH